MKKIFFLLTFLLVGSSAFAHERQVIKIGGTDYLFIIGSLNESVVVGDKSGLDMRVSLADVKDYSTTTSKAVVPVEGLEKTLKVENISGNNKKEFPITASWGKKGSYESLFYPSSSSKFTYRIFGSINNTPVDLKFTCNTSGHVMTPGMDMATSSTMTNGDFPVVYHSGSFGCPKEKADLIFPPSNWKDTAKQNIFGLIALALVLIHIVQNRKK